MTAASDEPRTDRVAWIILAIALAYGASFLGGWPQRWTAAAAGGHATPEAADPAPDADGESAAAADATDRAGAPPPIWTVVPFVLLLGAIAAFPLIHATEHWWESNLHRFYVAAGLGLLTLGYYAFLHREAIDLHWPAHSVVAAADRRASRVRQGGPRQRDPVRVHPVHRAAVQPVHDRRRHPHHGDLRADPLTNAAFMAVGGLLASFIGTTGAAMLLIRPLLETNRERKHVAHTVIFFIFIVCNCGGCLLPIGDPPLFLGYLQGVSFFWTLGLWPEWAVRQRRAAGRLLPARPAASSTAAKRMRDIERDVDADPHARDSAASASTARCWSASCWPSRCSIPTKPFPGTDWHPWMYFREVVQLLLVAASLLLRPAQPRVENNFNYAAIIEVAALFIGIFICMQPALDILRANGAYLVERFDMGPGKFFWASGALSSFLDNAPTYLVFFQTARGDVARRRARPPACRRADSRGHQPRLRLRRRHDLHRQRPELHGQGDRREVGREDAELLRLHGLQLPDPAADPGAELLDVSGEVNAPCTAPTITAERDLEALCERLRRAPLVGLDTEFVSEDTFHPELCLVQLITPDEAAVVDPQKVDVRPLWHAVVAGRRRRRLARRPRGAELPAALRRRTMPERIFDVQIAAGFASNEYPAAYGSVVGKFLGQQPMKGEQRTDWRRRPLTDAQITYALEDVRYLLPLYERLTELLDERGRRAWFDEEMATWREDVAAAQDRKDWRRVSGIGSLNWQEPGHRPRAVALAAGGGASGSTSRRSGCCATTCSWKSPSARPTTRIRSSPSAACSGTT